MSIPLRVVCRGSCLPDAELEAHRHHHRRLKSATLIAMYFLALATIPASMSTWSFPAVPVCPRRVAAGIIPQLWPALAHGCYSSGLSSLQVQLRQTQSRSSKSFPTAQFKDSAGENRSFFWRPTRITRQAEGPQAGDCQQDNGGIQFQLTHPGAPLRQNTSIYWSGEDGPIS
ncbi:hypothetical protein T02_13509 [Trichinella nativa]|uniref:Uncharacterized protein n=1 Tax=Trichinella nativa TaxID=6335 RepID=A0A0V1LLX1_9BILA|nr:hypothetical protein T02_13509 [Trichinella nativa]